MKIRVLTIAAIVAMSATAVAQDITQAPTYSTLDLNTGFVPDPNTVSLAAGGSIEVSSDLGAGCTGYVANAPDVRLNYTAGETFPLNIYVTSDADTTLVVNLPDGSWLCNDDSQGFNPLLTMASPMSGQYDIWVGSYDGDSLPAATLKISEIDPQW